MAITQAEVDTALQAVLMGFATVEAAIPGAAYAEAAVAFAKSAFDFAVAATKQAETTAAQIAVQAVQVEVAGEEALKFGPKP
jgi:hypothetical protein